MLLRRHRWWLLPELLAVAIAAAVVIYFWPPSLHDELGDRAQTLLEQLSPSDLELYVRHEHAAGQSTKVMCTAEAFAMEPATAERVEDVKIVYARYLCALVQSGTSWDFASRSSGPAVIRLGDPPAIEIVRSGEGFPERVRAVFPDDLERQAFASFTDKGRPRDLLMRFNEAVS